MKNGKNDLINKMVEVYNGQEDGRLTKIEAAKVLAVFQESVIALVQDEGDSLDLQSFLKIEKVLGAARKGRNPQTGEIIETPAKVRTKAKAKF